jgi:hypothetical protein
MEEEKARAKAARQAKSLWRAVALLPEFRKLPDSRDGFGDPVITAIGRIHLLSVALRNGAESLPRVSRHRAKGRRKRVGPPALKAEIIRRSMHHRAKRPSPDVC